ncbi:MAG: DNA-binding protein [Herbinix sp.]|jgi:transcriptional regulator with XRE-family HTH domain|nr:DNA-binding protein [Herbinix sp.]
MKEIQIGTIIAAKRKERGITQEELANHLGVSKPAVSKWESGQSYPDILLLPILASYFDITVDQLIGYEPQMTKEDIRKLYYRLTQSFTKEPFEKVFSECEEYLRKYFSCWQLQFQIGALLLNHCNLAGSMDRTKEMIEIALELFLRIEKSSEDVHLAKLSIQMQAVCHMSLARPQEAIDLMENQVAPLMSPESILVKAYQMKGDKAKAIEYLQGYTYINLVTMLGAVPDYFALYGDQPERMDEYYHIFHSLSQLFALEELSPATLINIYISGAMAYANQDKKEKAIEILETYSELILKLDKETITLHGNRIFDALEGYFKVVDVETDAPRRMELIRKDMRSSILANPAFANLEGLDAFQRIKRKLER